MGEPLRLDRFRVLCFDCYGTLIDWERGITAALRPVLAAHGVRLEGEEILQLYAELEPEAERGDFVPYREVLSRVVRAMGERLGFATSRSEEGCLADSLGEWPPFPDTVAALEGLGRRYRLAVLSNVDEDLFALTARRLGVRFDPVITAERVGSYKPSPRNFEYALERMGVPPRQVLHVAQSLYHDIAPATSLGLSTVWVKRRAEDATGGATPAAVARPDLVVPDLAALAERVERDGGRSAMLRGRSEP
ncbi:MAG: haloacid dehalogenase type II [Gemmatimonadota bacterium]